MNKAKVRISWKKDDREGELSPEEKARFFDTLSADLEHLKGARVVDFQSYPALIKVKAEGWIDPREIIYLSPDCQVEEAELPRWLSEELDASSLTIVGVKQGDYPWRPEWIITPTVKITMDHKVVAGSAPQVGSFLKSVLDKLEEKEARRRLEEEKRHQEELAGRGCQDRLDPGVAS